MTDQASVYGTLLLSEAEAAARLLVSARTLRDIRRQGRIKYVAITARKIAYRPEDCEEYVAAHVRVESPANPSSPPPKLAKGKGPCEIIPFSQRKGKRG